MSLSAPLPIPPLLASLSDALEEIRQMLLRYEASMIVAPTTPETRRAAQDFDLAVQILQDLEHVTQQLAKDLPPGLMSENSLPLAGLLLERNRRRFMAAVEGKALPNQGTSPMIELF